MRRSRVESAQCGSCKHTVEGYPPERCPQCGAIEWTLVGPSVADIKFIPGDPPTVVVTQPLARDWYDDAKDEAGREGMDACRREILFSMCFAECYLVDWVRDHIAD